MTEGVHLCPLNCDWQQYAKFRGTLQFALASTLVGLERWMDMLMTLVCHSRPMLPPGAAGYNQLTTLRLNVLSSIARCTARQGPDNRM